MTPSALELALLPAMSDRIYYALIERFGSAESAFAAAAKAIVGAAGISEEAARRLFSARSREAARGALADATREGRWIVGERDSAYPPLLREIYRPPRFLNGRGSLDDPPEMRVAIVGSRRTDHRSRDAASALAGGLAERGYTVVSGLARGVDTAAHEGALRGGGRTIAVLGSGLDEIYPPENAELADRIAACGALVSPFPPRAAPTRYSFPDRNRTVAGLCRAVVVVQAPIHSGALITARLALESNREVFTMPGPVGEPRYAGSNALLRDGARPCLDLSDIVAELEGVAEALSLRPPAGEAGSTRGGAGASRAARDELSEAEASVLASLSTEPLHVDAIARSAGLAPAKLLVSLLSLEMKGLVQALPGKHFARRVELTL